MAFGKNFGFDMKVTLRISVEAMAASYHLVNRSGKAPIPPRETCCRSLREARSLRFSREFY